MEAPIALKKGATNPEQLGCRGILDIVVAIGHLGTLTRSIFQNEQVHILVVQRRLVKILPMTATNRGQPSDCVRFGTIATLRRTTRMGLYAVHRYAVEYNQTYGYSNYFRSWY